VTQIHRIDELLRSKKLIFVTGKGGIGKTTVSAALALRAESLGLRTLLVEQASVEQLGAITGFKGVGHEETWRGSLGVANYTPQGTFHDFLTKHLMKSSLLDLVVGHKVVSSFFSAVPGFSELTLLGRLYYGANLAPAPRPDLIIFDAYASGHFLSLMTTPQAVIKSGLAGPILSLTTKVRDWISNPDVSGTIYVAIPEELVMSEAVDFLPALARKSPSKLAAIFLNRCLPSSSPPLSADGGGAWAFLERGRARQKELIARLSSTMGGDELLRHVPVYSGEEYGALPEPLTIDVATQLLKGRHGT
jgi:anion-transporting  ArsA/GET3 family ATPase